MSRWSLRRILGSLFVVAGLVTLLIVVLVGTAMVRLDHARTDRVDVYGPASLNVETLAKSYSDQETGLRGFISIDKRSFLKPYRTGRDVERRQEQILRRTLRHRPDLLRRLDAVQDAAGVWHSTVAEPAITRTERQGPKASTARDIEDGKASFDRIRSALRALQQPVLASRDAAGRVLDQQLDLLRAVLAGSLLLLLVVAALTAFALRRFITDPLRQLGREVDVVEAGELNHPVDFGAAPAEVLQLTRQVDRMRMRIVQEYALAENARLEAIDARLLVEEQAVDLQRSNAELEQFAYVASHDLQEPLRKVASFCQLLERRYKGQLDERADQYIEFAVDGAKRMQQLINDLLAFSRVGRLTAPFSDVDLDTTLDQALRQVDASIEESGATVIHDPLPTVSGDGTLLVQLFQNLVGNAVKFRGEQSPVIRLGARRDGDDWELYCSDNGIGIEPQYADKIFVIFQRLHGRDAYGGTGIGLAMCKKIVEYHGGRMWLDHEATQGATFRWTLPVRAEDRADQPPTNGTSTNGTSTNGTPTNSSAGIITTTHDERSLDERVPAHPADRGSPGGGRPG
jgi:signal transduction histidine kinase